MLTAVATKSLKIVIFNHLMLVDDNFDDSVAISSLVVDLKVSVALKKNVCGLTRAFWAQILDPPLVMKNYNKCCSLTFVRNVLFSQTLSHNNYYNEAHN